MATRTATKSLAEDFSSVTVTFANDEARTVILEELPETIVAHLAAHGLSQKIGDSYAGLGDDLPKAIENVDRVIKDLMNDSWTTRTAGSGGPRITQLVEALVRVSGRTLDECQTVVENLETDERKALRNSDPIKLAVAEIKLEKAQRDQGEETLDVSALFAA